MSDHEKPAWMTDDEVEAMAWELEAVMMKIRADPRAALTAGLGRVLINRDCSAITGCPKRRVRCAESSGDFLTPSPPAEKATARQDQAEKAKFSHPRLKKIASFHCGSMMSKGNSRTNGISDRESNGQPNYEDHPDIGHISAPTAS